MMSHINAFVTQKCNTALDYAICDSSYRAYKGIYRDLEFSLTILHIYATEIAAMCEDMGMTIMRYVAGSDPYTTGDFCTMNIFMKDDGGCVSICAMSMIPSGDMRCACSGTLRSEGIFLSSHYIDMAAIRAAALVSTGHKVPWDYR
jgi:hypothetical protein